MKGKQRKASWWLPVVMMGGMLGVLFVEALDPDLLPIEPGIQMVTIIAGFVLLGAWVNVNRGWLEDGTEHEYSIEIIEPRQVTDAPVTDDSQNPTQTFEGWQLVDSSAKASSTSPDHLPRVV